MKEFWFWLAWDCLVPCLWGLEWGVFGAALCDLLFALQMSPGIIANPFAAGIGRKNSLESISSIDRDLSPEELEILQKVSAGLAGSTLQSGILCACLGMLCRGTEGSSRSSQDGAVTPSGGSGAADVERAVGEVALTLLSPRRWKW